MASPLSRIKALLFFSGAAGLIYEVLWTRQFSDIVGSTAVSMTVVFSVFLLCLAIGARVAGRIERFGGDALRLYAKLEFGIAAMALVAGLILTRYRGWIAGQLPEPDWFALSLLVKFVATGVIIGAPALLMGATVPVALNAVRDGHAPKQTITQLYGWNTLGAAFGTLVSGYLLIGLIGVQATLLSAACLNIAVGLGAVLMARGATTLDSPLENAEKRAPPALASTEARASRAWLSGFAFLSGFCVLGYEILWGRLARFFLGDRTIATTTLLFAYIACLGLGSLAAGVVGDDRGDTTARRGLTIGAWTLILGAMAQLIFVPLAVWGIRSDGFAFLGGLFPEFFKRIVCVWLLIGIPTLILGVVFPLLTRSSEKLQTSPGGALGDLYFVNTLGAVLGAGFACFALSRWCGTLGGFLAITGLIVAFSGAFLLQGVKTAARRLAIGAVATLYIIGAILAPKSLVTVLEGETLVASVEDEYGVHVLVDTEDGGARVRNNRIQLIATLGEPATMHAQQMMAHVPALLARECRTTLNLGAGYGITTGVFTLYDSVEIIDTVELMPFVIDIQGRFAEQNFDYLNDPRTTMIQNDGRHFLFASKKTYDVICVNVLDPYLPGSSALYTVEFWEEARRHLRPGGVYNQLVWGGHLPLMVKGLETVFPTVIYFREYDNGAYNVAAFAEKTEEADLELHLDRLTPRAREQFVFVTGKEPEEHFAEMVKLAWKARAMLGARAALAKGRFHSDNFPILEYGWENGTRDLTVFDTPMVDY